MSRDRHRFSLTTDRCSITLRLLSTHNLIELWVGYFLKDFSEPSRFHHKTRLGNK
jgi:hypothetical protein